MNDAIEGAFNFRSMSGLTTSYGIVKPGVYRSDLLHRGDTEAATVALGRMGVTYVIDLRVSDEPDADGALASHDTVEVIHRPLLETVWSWADERDAADEWYLRDRTIETLTDRGTVIVELLHELVERGPGLVFHCTAGKDRTGTFAAVLLALLGADHHTIATDYARSAAAMPDIINWYRSTEFGDEFTPEQQAGIDHIVATAARPETMLAVLDFVDAHYGSMANWAQAFGAVPELETQLRTRFLHREPS